MDQEFKASERLATNELDALGFDVQRGVAELPTAFKATVDGRPGGPTIGIQAEYDALPDIGHACGHNLIAGAAVGAERPSRRSSASSPCRIMVIGTPAEEGGGGKIIMLDRGAYDDVDAALYVHAQTRNASMGGNMAHASMTVRFHGVPASIALESTRRPRTPRRQRGQRPDRDVQQRQRDSAAHPARRGRARDHQQGRHPPRDRAAADRGRVPRPAARNHQYLKEVIERFGKCAEAAALATYDGQVIPGNVYAERLLNVPFSKAVFDNMVRAGLQDVIQDGTAASSTDSVTSATSSRSRRRGSPSPTRR